jgi:predicted transport protein
VQVWAPVRDPSIRLYLHLDPETVQLEDGFIADMRNKGHWGTGDLEVVVRNLDSLEKAKPLIVRSFNQS